MVCAEGWQQPLHRSLNRRKFLLALSAAVMGGAGLGVVAQRALAPSESASSRPQPQRRIRAVHFVTRLDGVAAAPAWSPSGDAIAVQHFRSGGRVVGVYDADPFEPRFTIPGSLPTWSPTGDELAVIDPFPSTMPPRAPATVRAHDARTGAVKNTMTVLTSSIAWAVSGLRAVVNGEAVDLDPSGSRQLTRCGGACVVVLWSADAEYFVSSDPRDGVASYAVHRVATGERLATLGQASGSLAWASRVPVLVGRFSRGALRWSPDRVEELNFPEEVSPVVTSADGQIVLATAAGPSSTWFEWHASDQAIRELDLGLPSTRGLTWDPRSRFLTSLVLGFGLSGQLEVYSVEFES